MGIAGRGHRGLRATALDRRQRLHEPTVLPAAVDPRGDRDGALPGLPGRRRDSELEAGAAAEPLHGGVPGVRVGHLPAAAARHDRRRAAGDDTRAAGRVREEEKARAGGGYDDHAELVEHARDPGEVLWVNLGKKKENISQPYLCLPV